MEGDGFAPPAPDQAPAEGGALYGSGPFDQFAPPGPGGAFSAPAPEQFSAPGSGQFPQPDPNQFQPANIGPGGGPGQFQAPNTGYGSGQFQQPDTGQFQTPPPGVGQFQAPQPDPGQFPAPGSEYGSGQFAQPDPGFPAPQPHTGQFPVPGGGYGSGQFPQPDPNQFQPGGPGQVAPDGGQFQPPAQQPGGYAPQPGPAPAPEPEQGGPIYSWAPPPMPAAPPPVPQQQFQQAPPSPAHNPPTGQFQTPNWGTEPGRPPAAQPPQPQQFQQQFQQPGQPGQQQFQSRQMPEPGQLGNSVNDLNLLKRARKAPRSGWRRAVHKVSRGTINPGESASDVVHRDLVGRVNAPVYGDFRIAILSLKGGVGKTTTTVGLGATFASLRGDRVIAIDANPDLGTLAHRVPRQTRSTVRNLLEDQNITRYSDVRAHTSQSPSRLEVLASEQDPAVSEAFSEADYRRAIGILQSFYNIILTDCGTGLMHSAMSGVLDMASSLVLVTSPAIDGARSASATLDWLDYHGYSHLVQQTVVVVNASRRGSTSVNLDHLRRLFLDRTRAVQVVPFDDHLAEGAEIDLELVSKPTRQALLELAAMVADDFASVDGYPYGNRY
ncbi:MAG: AAA family ATPase [Nocardia sp.]|nr:AAA family ATPase [Nocardia sp.]